LWLVLEKKSTSQIFQISSSFLLSFIFGCTLSVTILRTFVEGQVLVSLPAERFDPISTYSWSFLISFTLALLCLNHGLKSVKKTILQIFGELNPANLWTIDSVNVEGITYISPLKTGCVARLYILGDNTHGLPQVHGFIDVCDMPALDDNSTSLPIVSRLSSNAVDNGLIDSKMSALYYFEDVLYFLHDNSALVRD
jgi:hypothetical protein